MAEELQHLIDRIQKDAVDKADQEGHQIIANAKSQAASIVAEAEEKAAKIIEKADQDSQAYTERSTKALEQAARDILITVGQGVENILSDLVSGSLDEAMDIQTLKDMIVRISEAYGGRAAEINQVDVLISPNDEKELVKFFAERAKQRLVHGLEVHVDNDIIRGFKVGIVDDNVQHDFTKEAIAEALGNFLRPHLAEIVHRAARNGAQTEGVDA